MRNFSHSIKQRVLGTLAMSGVSVVRASDCNEIRAALNLLRPFETEHTLIRFGSIGDGGYLLPNDLDDIKYILSPGVADNWSFEDQLWNRTGANIQMIECAEIPNDIPYAVTKGFLGGYTDSHQLGVNNWISDLNITGKGDGLLSMDIEGGEYEVLLGISEEYLQEFRIITVEFHNLGRLADANWLNGVFMPVLKKIDQSFVPVHVHGNNHVNTVRLRRRKIPQLLEVTFHRRDRIHDIRGYARLPHVFDQQCDPSVPEVGLEELWRSDLGGNASRRNSDTGNRK
jgi:hypothetical protein